MAKFDISKLFDTRTTQVGNYAGAKEYTTPGIIHEFWNKITGQNQNLISPLADEYTPPPSSNSYNQTVQTPQEQYTQVPTQSPEILPAFSPATEPTQVPAQQKYTYYDKAPIPPQFYETLDSVPNNELVGSILAQETGGYKYGIMNPATGKVVTQAEAKRLNLRGDAGEVGMAQIIPKYYWKEAGFPDEESYAQTLYDGNFSIKEAARIMAKNIAVAGGDIRKALGSWNKAPNYPDEILSRIGQGGEQNAVSQ